MTQIAFADVEGDDFLPGLNRLWTIQLATGVDGDVEVFADQPGYRPIREGLNILKDADRIVFHNGLGYDYWAINKIYPGTLRWQQIIDTLVISRLMDSTAKRHSLRDLGEALRFPKGEHDDFSQFSEKMAKYGRRDVQILQEAWKGKRPVRSFGQFYEKFKDACELEFQTAYVIEKQVQHGFRFDYEAGQKLEAELRQEKVNLERQLQEIFPPIVEERWSEKTGKRLKDKTHIFNPGSRQQIAERLIDRYGWKPKEFTGKSKQVKVDETILDGLPYPEAKMIARYMELGKKLGMLAEGQNAWLKIVDAKPDGSFYAHGYVNTLGCRTHRMAHSKPNMAQCDSDPRMRKLWLPDPGHKLVGIDAEGLELRMLAHYLFKYDGGKYSEFVHNGDKKKGTDVHSMNRKAAGLYLRDSAKTMIYAHNYGAFDKKLGTVVVDDAKEAGKPVPSGSLSKIGGQLRSKIEVGIEGLGLLIDKCKKQHRKKKALVGLDGRYIPSASDHSALNTLLQGNGSVVMKKALCLFDDEVERRGLSVGYCGNIHDEVVVSVDPSIAKEIKEIGMWAIAEAGVQLGVRCPLVGEAKIGDNWSETH